MNLIIATSNIVEAEVQLEENVKAIRRVIAAADLLIKQQEELVENLKMLRDSSVATIKRLEVAKQHLKTVKET
jgi:hypothetical protein